MNKPVFIIKAKHLVIAKIAFFLSVCLISLVVWQQHNAITELSGELENIRAEILNFRRISYFGRSEDIAINVDQMALDFIQSEARLHRQFIENERAQLLVTLGALLAIGASLLTFLGIANRKEVEQAVKESLDPHIYESNEKAIESLDLHFREKLPNEINERISKTLPKEINKALPSYLSKELQDTHLKMLKRNIDREKRATNIKVCFAACCEDDKTSKDYYSFEQVHGYLKNEKYNIVDEILELTDNNYKDIVEESRIIVYMVPLKSNLYKDLAKIASDTKKQCILYTPKGDVNLNSIEDRSVITTVRFPSKIRETLYMLLYFSQLNKS